jgi:hypothetical protein
MAAVGQTAWVGPEDARLTPPPAAPVSMTRACAHICFLVRDLTSMAPRGVHPGVKFLDSGLGPCRGNSRAVVPRTATGSGGPQCVPG